MGFSPAGFVNIVDICVSLEVALKLQWEVSFVAESLCGKEPNPGFSGEYYVPEMNVVSINR